MPHILVCGYNHHGYLDSVARGFAAAGWRVELFAHRNAHQRKAVSGNPFSRLKSRFVLGRLNGRLQEAVRRGRPDAVLFINAGPVLLPTLQWVAERAASALWAVDALESLQLPPENLAAFHCRFLFEPADLGRAPAPCAYLPYGFDPQFYHPLGREAAYDVSFVGAPHENRLPVLDRVAALCAERGLRFAVMGPGYRREAGLERNFPALARALAVDRPLDAAEINEIYNRSKIVLNIHHTQSKDGINPRTFEIAGAGAFQLVDHKKMLERFFAPGEEIISYADTGDALEKILRYLRDDAGRMAVAARARERALREHTFAARCAGIARSLAAFAPPAPPLPACPE